MSQPHPTDIQLQQAIEGTIDHFGVEQGVIVLKSPDSGMLIFLQRGTLPTQLGLTEIAHELLKRSI